MARILERDGKRKLYMTIIEFAGDNQVSRMTVFRWMKQGLPNMKPDSRTGRGQAVLIPVSEGREWVVKHAPILPRGRRQ